MEEDGQDQAGAGGGQGVVLQAEDLPELDLSQEPQGSFSQVLDLIGARVQLGEANEDQGGGGGGGGQQQQQQQEPPIVQSPFVNDPAMMAEYLPLLMDNCTHFGCDRDSRPHQRQYRSRRDSLRHPGDDRRAV